MATIINNLPKGNVKAPQGAIMKINTGEQLHNANFNNNTEFVLEFTLDNLDPNDNPIYVRSGITEDEVVIGRKAGAIQVEYNMPNIPLEGEKMNFYYDCGAPFSIDTIFTKYPLQAQQIECYFKVWNQEDTAFQESQSLTAQYASNDMASYIYTMENGSPLVWYIDVKTAIPAEDLTALGENMTTAMWGSGTPIISPGRYLLYSSGGQYLYRFELNAQTESLSNTSLEFLPNQIKLQGQVSYEDEYNDTHTKRPTISLFPEADLFNARLSLTGDDLVIENNVFFEGNVNLSMPLQVNFKTQTKENLSSKFHSDPFGIDYRIIQYNTNFYILEVLQDVSETSGPFGFSIPKSYFNNKQYITFLGFTTAHQDEYLRRSSYPIDIKSYLSNINLELHYKPQNGNAVQFYKGDIFMFMAF